MSTIPNKGRFQKGHKPSEESRRKMSLSRLGSKNHFYGKIHSEKTKDKIRAAHWKGDNITYRRLHSWVVQEKGKASKCEQADNTCKGIFVWSNISHQYKRDLNDFQQLCASHHVRYDMTDEWRANLSKTASAKAYRGWETRRKNATT